jgi:hypothetical protein
VGAALAPDGVHAPWLLAGAMATTTVSCSITEQLAPPLRPGPGVGRATLSGHTAARLRPASEARPCPLRFLPPSSPDCTPMAQAFSTSKAILRGLGARTNEALQEAVRLAIEAISRHDAAAWFAYAGYPLPVQDT